MLRFVENVRKAQLRALEDVTKFHSRYTIRFIHLHLVKFIDDRRQISPFEAYKFQCGWHKIYTRSINKNHNKIKKANLLKQKQATITLRTTSVTDKKQTR